MAEDKGKTKPEKKKTEKVEEQAKNAEGKAKKSEDKGKKPVKGKVKKEKQPDGLIEIKHSKAKQGERNPATGTRFKVATSQQIAYDIVRDCIKAGKDTFKDIRAELNSYRKENGKDKDLEAGYLNYVLASHPEDFEARRDEGVEKIKLLNDVQPDPEAVKKELEKEEKKKKARQERKAGKKKTEKPEKPEKPKKPVAKKK